MIKAITRSFYFICLMSLTSCGGGSVGCDGISALFGAAASSTCGISKGQVEEQVLPGVVVDGLIEGAIVCLDLNVNLVCDAGEPFSTSSSKGGFSLSLAGLSTAQIRGAHVITSVPLNAKDSDDGGQTLEQVGKTPFNLMSPAEAFVSSDGVISSVVVSPLTTLISHEMITGIGKAAGAAEASVVSKLGMPEGSDLHANFFGQTDTASLSKQKYARFISAALGEVKAAIGTGESSSTDRERQLGALSYIKTNLTALVAAINSSNATTAATQRQAANAALANSEVMPRMSASSLISEAKVFISSSNAIDAVSASATTLLNSVYYLDCRGSSGGVNNGIWENICYKWLLTKSQPIIGGWTGQTLTVTNSAWTPITEVNNSTGYYLTPSGWRLNSAVTEKNTVYESDGAGGWLLTIKNELGDIWVTVRINSTIKDVSGKKVSEVTGKNIAPYLSVAAAATFNEAIFSTGSTVRIDKVTNERPLYLAGGLFGSSSGSCNQPPCAALPTPSSFLELYQAYPTSKGGDQSGRWLSCSDYVNARSNRCSFDEGGSETKGTMTRWAQTGSQGTWVALPEKGSYEIRSVMGQPLLSYVSPASIIASRTVPFPETLFAVIDGVVTSVIFFPKGVLLGDGTYSNLWNELAIRAVLAGAGLPSLPP